MAVAEPKTCIGGNHPRINHYYPLHSLPVEIHVPSRGCILRKGSVCLHKFGIIFSYSCFVHHIKISGYVFELFFFQLLLVSKNIAISCYNDTLIARSILCVCAQLRFLKTKKFDFFFFF